MRPALSAAILLVASAAVQAADIGGWMEHKSRIELARDDCPALIAQAARTASSAEGAAQRYYASGLCYLHSDQVARDPVAAMAWLARAAELEHPLARRALLSLREPAPIAHPSAYHCHELGLGRRLCHGGGPLQ
jgi:TPR repeat protein